MSIKKQIQSLSKFYTIYDEVPESFLDETDVDSYFYHNILDIALIDNWIVNQLKNQQRFNLQEEVSVSLKDLAANLNTLRQFLKHYDKTVKFPALYPLPKAKQEIGFTLFEDQLLAHYFQDIKEHCNRQIRLSSRFERKKECCFSIKNFQTVGEQTVLTEIINLRPCEVHSFHKNCYYIASKCGIFDSNYDIWLKHSCSSTLPRPKYSGTHRRCDLIK